ncbi:MerR family transcriptional regulator [Sulfurifustis variabilis]|uniref:MerR family transcriptional regulator n=1 Tax=Sulfurifustis variabilis TaxID=1675686 RepID=A0A1B4VG28_9GAMM|nr:MerR family transcriptional regulator [Sulfurifustis variabilis]BAU49737.1 MerR family transcriptional regulator [Sulfurifustis variabilis]
MLTVSQLSKRGSVSPHVIRYYARIQLLEPARHPENGYRLFSNDDVGRLRFIRKAQRLGYTLEEIRGFLKLQSEGKSPCHQVRGVLKRRLEDNRAKIAELLVLQQRMERALAIWESLPDPHEGSDGWWRLIEAAGAEAEAT